MANSIAYVKNYTAVLDEAYRRAACSTCLNSLRRMARAGRNAKEIMVPKIEVSGLGDYTRNVGYKTGSITYEFETKTFNYDRGIRLLADVMDVEEAGVLDCFVAAGSELQRTQVAPEAEAFTFSEIAGHESVTPPRRRGLLGRRGRGRAGVAPRGHERDRRGGGDGRKLHPLPPLRPRIRILRAVGEILFGEPGALGVRLGDIDALDLEDHGARAVVAAGNHHAIVRGPAVHDGAALQRRVDVAADAVPRLRTGELRVQIAPEVPEIVLAVLALEQILLPRREARARPARRVRQIARLQLGKALGLEHRHLALMFHNRLPLQNASWSRLPCTPAQAIITHKRHTPYNSSCSCPGATA